MVLRTSGTACWLRSGIERNYHLHVVRKLVNHDSLDKLERQPQPGVRMPKDKLNALSRIDYSSTVSIVPRRRYGNRQFRPQNSVFGGNSSRLGSRSV
jgi:hypothetical protein